MDFFPLSYFLVQTEEELILILLQLFCALILAPVNSSQTKGNTGIPHSFY